MATWQASNVNAGTSVGIGVMYAQPYVVSKVVDYAVVIGDVGALGTTDTLEVLPVPANTLVLAAGFEVLSAETVNTTGTLSLGDGADVDRYVAAVAVTATGQKTYVNSTGTFAYSSADTIDLVSATDDLTNAKVRVWAVMCDLATAATDTDWDTYSS